MSAPYMILVSSKFLCPTNTRGARCKIKACGYDAVTYDYYSHESREAQIMEYVVAKMPHANRISIRGVSNPQDSSNVSYYIVQYAEMRG